MRIGRIKKIISSVLGQRRLPHGHTHLTWIENDVVYKKFSGPKSRALYNVEYESLKHMNLRIPVPEIVSSDQSNLTIGLRRIEGDCIIEAPYPEPALECHRQAGSILRRIQHISPPSGFRRGEYWVHGDYNPKNIIYSSNPNIEISVLDWEQAHFGSSMEDPCWYELVILTTFSQNQANEIIKAFYDGYGFKPEWSTRKDEMVRRLESIISEIDDKIDIRVFDYWNQQLEGIKRMTPN